MTFGSTTSSLNLQVIAILYLERSSDTPSVLLPTHIAADPTGVIIVGPAFMWAGRQSIGSIL